MKKFLLSFFCLAGLVSYATAEEVTVTFKEQGYENAEEITELAMNDQITVTFDKGESNTDPKYYSTGNAFRLYAKNVMTISANNGLIINSVSMTTASGDYVINAASTVSCGTLTVDGTNATINNIDASEVTFTQGGTKGHARIISLTVNYSAAIAGVSIPTFSVGAGTHHNPFSVEIAATEGAKIYYTLDGSEPTSESTEYTEAIEFNEFGTTTTIKAIAVVNNEMSAVNTATYTLSVAAPQFSVKGGVYEKISGNNALKFTTETTSATIYYNDRGGDPITEGSKNYGSLSILSTKDIKAVAYVTNANGDKIYSDVVSEKYYISPVKPFEKSTEFVAGKYIMYANGIIASPVSETANYEFLQTAAATTNGNFIETNAFYAFTFTEVEGGYTIQDTFGRYMYMTEGYNNFNVSASKPASGAVWTVSIDGTTGEATITNVAMNKYIQYSAGYNSFGSYETAQSNSYKPALYAIGEYPTLVVSPGNWETIPQFAKVTITCESGIEYNETEDIYPHYTIGWDYTPYEFDNVDIIDECTIELTFNTPIQENGDYRVILPAGLFILNPNGLAMASEKVQYTYTVDNPNVLEVVYANPNNGDNVSSIEYLYFEFNQNIAKNVNSAVITNEKGEEFSLAVTNTDGWGDTTPGNVLCLKTVDPITTPGVYTFVLKKEYVYTASNVRLTEDIRYTFTITESLKTTSITPIVETNAISEILIECNKEISCLAEGFLAMGEDETEIFFTPSFTDKEGNELPYNSIRLVTETPITAAGKYVLHIEDYSIATTDWMNQEFIAAQAYAFIFDGSSVSEDTGIDNILGENTENVIYDLTGRKVNAITVSGIYIVNGKKILVK